MSSTQLTFWALFLTHLYILSNAKQLAVLQICHAISCLCRTVHSAYNTSSFSVTASSFPLLHYRPHLYIHSPNSDQNARFPTRKSILCDEYAAVSAYATLHLICFTLYSLLLKYEFPKDRIIYQTNKTHVLCVYTNKIAHKTPIG